jgi:pimeloyl-ACP methyl ester carboxylesterase
LLLATEAPRAGLDLAALLGTWPLLWTAPRGDGHPVLVLPGLLAGDPSTVLLRRFLRALGHNVSGWSLGTNRGPSGHVVDELRAQLERLHRDCGRRVSLVGWSLGGLYAQELARASPGSVRRLITLGTPVYRRSTWTRTVSRIADQVPSLPGSASLLPRPWAEPGSLRVPAMSVYTRADGIVAWSTCRYQVRPRRENVEVRGAHLGLAHNPAVLWVLADRLGQAEGRWKPFRPPMMLSALFPMRL